MWVAGLDVPENGVTSKALTEKDLNANLDVYPTENPWIPLPNVKEFMMLPAATNVSMKDYNAAAAAKKKQLAKKRKAAKS